MPIFGKRNREVDREPAAQDRTREMRGEMGRDGERLLDKERLARDRL